MSLRPRERSQSVTYIVRTSNSVGKKDILNVLYIVELPSYVIRVSCRSHLPAVLDVLVSCVESYQLVNEGDGTKGRREEEGG